MILLQMTMRISRSGRFKTGVGLEDAFVQTEAIPDGSAELLAALEDNTPVVSGLGKASWQVNEAHWLGNSLIQNAENTAENKGVRYIPIANVRSRLHKGFIQRGVAQGRERVVEAVKARVAEVKSNLWVPR